jgi:hypothetical protein
LDSSRLRTGEIVAGIGGLAMFVFLFFDWFGGGAELTGTAGNLELSSSGISGWNALTDLPGFLIILSGVSGIALACLAGAGQRLNIPLRRGAFTATLGALAVLLILWRLVAGSPTLKIGIFLGLAAAIAITVGALMALAEDGFEVLVAVPGARTRTAAASAPPATPSPPPTAAATATKTAQRSSSSGGSTTKRKASSRGSTTKRSTTKRSATKGSTTKKKSSSRSRGKKTTSTRSRSSSKKSGAKKK